MSQIIATEKAQKIHRILVERMHALPPIMLDASALHLADVGETNVPHRASDRIIRLAQSSGFGIRQLGPAKFELSYDPNAPEQALDALMAAGTGANAPICGDAASLALLTLAKRVAVSDIPVLVEGATGTGKEVLARYLHNASARRDGPFIAVNCAAMPEAMLEALLFGHRKGAFTGASDAQQGFFRAADGGTLLLDEVGEMPLALQAKLLRALQEGEVTPLGATQPVAVDVRIVACTNRYLPQEVSEGRFREDLYYRLNVFPLRNEALRERQGDIGPLAYGLLLKHGGAGATPRWISTEAMAVLCGHNWPGNVRELENVIRRAMLLAGAAQCIGAEHVRFDHKAHVVVAESPTQPPPRAAVPDATALSEIAFQSEAKAILKTLDECGGHRIKTAQRLGISERTLRYRLANMREAGLAIAGAGS